MLSGGCYVDFKGVLSGIPSLYFCQASSEAASSQKQDFGNGDI